jgi:acetyl esterase/lipase
MPMRLRICLAVTLCLICFTTRVSAQHAVFYLWPHDAPGSEGKTALPESVRISPEGFHVLTNINRPSITAYLPNAADATGTAVLVIPGGGHSEIWIDHEGYTVATWLSEHGIAAFILKYRLARQQSSTYTVEGTELQDAQRALRQIRSHAGEWNVNPERIGVIGFSAGGELAALAGTRFDVGDRSAADPIDRLTSRPAFQGLFYPGIPQDMRFSRDTPPAFLACGSDDRPSIAEGLPLLYLQMKHSGVAAELHIFAGTAHGFGIRNGLRPNVSDWPDLFFRWLSASGFISVIHPQINALN